MFPLRLPLPSRPAGTAVVVAALGVTGALLASPGPAEAMYPAIPWNPPAVAAASPPIGTPPGAPIGVALTATPAVRAALDARLDDIRTRTGIPGVSVAIGFPDGSLWVGAAGDADLAAGTPVAPATSFPIASISKTFTAALVLALVGDGRLGLDDSVDRLLPELDLDARITVRQLLDHTSGLRDFFMAPKIDAALQRDPGRRWDADDALAYVGKPYAKPGRTWHYSNTNYLILGLLAERVGRAPLADQLRDRFLTPLGLTHTWYQPTETPRGALAHAYRMPRARPDPTAVDLSDGSDIAPFTSVVTAAGGAGGMASSAADLVRWADALYGGEVLPPALVAAMTSDAPRAKKLGPGVHYGLGVQLGDVLGYRSMGHSGRLLGARSVVRWLPDVGVTIAVLTNQSRTDPAAIARSLLKVFLAPVPAPSASAPAATAKPSGTRASAD